MDYRPITITICASKLLELLVLDELNSSFSPQHLQCGFISHRGAMQAALLAGDTVQHTRRKGLPVLAANLANATTGPGTMVSSIDSWVI